MNLILPIITIIYTIKKSQNKIINPQKIPKYEQFILKLSNK